MQLCGNKDLKHVVELWIEAYETRNKELVEKLFSKEKECFHYGTGRDEYIYSLEGMFEQLERDWSQSTAAKLSLKGFRCQEISSDVAWIACEILPEIESKGVWHKLPEMRSSLVVTKKEGEWKIVHTHASWAYEEQKEGNSFPIS